MKRQPIALQANLTPMIDVTFLLIVFFVLVSQIVEVENADLDLPKPARPVSELPGEEHRVVINVLGGPDGRASAYRMGGRTYRPDTAGLEALTAALATLYQDDGGLSVNLRADRTTRYRWVEPLFGVVAAAARRSGREGVRGRVNLVVVREI